MAYRPQVQAPSPDETCCQCDAGLTFAGDTSWDFCMHCGEPLCEWCDVGDGDMYVCEDCFSIIEDDQ